MREIANKLEKKNCSKRLFLSISNLAEIFDTFNRKQSKHKYVIRSVYIQPSKVYFLTKSEAIIEILAETDLLR